MAKAAQTDYYKLLERALEYLCAGAAVVCVDAASTNGVPRFNAMTGGYSWDDDYVWDSWANFQWAGFLAGRLWLIHALTKIQRYGDAAMHICKCSPDTHRSGDDQPCIGQTGKDRKAWMDALSFGSPVRRLCESQRQSDRDRARS